jgi:hypothetical protein
MFSSTGPIIGVSDGFGVCVNLGVGEALTEGMGVGVAMILFPLVRSIFSIIFPEMKTAELLFASNEALEKFANELEAMVSLVRTFGTKTTRGKSVTNPAFISAFFSQVS